MTRIYTEEAELYDIAFGWDVSEEADWLVERLGAGCRSVLEPGCGSGRMLGALAARAPEAVGIDVSAEMVAYARARLGGAAEVVRADMTDFDLGRRFGGAVSLVSTVGVLKPAKLEAHLEAMARHLEPGARYLVQQGIDAGTWRSEWDAERGDLRLHVVWEAIDPDRSRSRVEILAGPRAGEVVEDLHWDQSWTAAAWAEAIAASPFEQAACYDGWPDDRPPAVLEQGGGYLWHELVAP